MKRILFLLALAAVLLSCGRNAYTINGIFTTDDGTDVYLIDSDRADTLAKTEVRDGRFSFAGNVKEPFYAYVGCGRTRVHMILEPGTFTVDIDERVASGGPMEDAYMAFHRQFYQYKREQRAEKAALADSVVRANPDNLVGALALEDLAYVDTSLFMTLYRQMSDRMREFRLVRNAFKAIDLQNSTAPGRMFTDFTVVGGHPDGSDVKLSDYVGRGKYILLDHWASWCGPCKAEMPNVVAAYKKYHDKGFEIVGLSFDSEKEPWVKAILEWNMPWIHLSDLKSWKTAAAGVYSVDAIPDNLLIDPEGIVVARGLRGDALEKRLAEAYQ